MPTILAVGYHNGRDMDMSNPEKRIRETDMKLKAQMEELVEIPLTEEQRMTPDPAVVNDTVILEAGTKIQYAGRWLLLTSDVAVAKLGKVR